MINRSFLFANLLFVAGCQTFSPLSTSSGNDDPLVSDRGTLEPAATGSNSVQSGFDKTKRFLTGKEQVDRQRAVELYRKGDDLFREAMKSPTEKSRDLYAEAGRTFARAAEAFPSSALEQDAMFMSGQSYFFANQLTKAEETLGTLQNQHPRNRHSEQAEKLLIAIARYWIDTTKAGAGSVIPVNFTDASRPWLDADGHAIRVFDQIRYDDPTGKLADDATMLAGIEYMRQKDYFQADQMFTDLRELFPDSDHQFNAHLLGLQCKLELYAGASYSGLVLEEADDIIKRMRQIFPNEMKDPETRDSVARSAAKVEYLQAEKLWNRATYREKQLNYGGAKVYYEQLLVDYPNTPFADQARERLSEISGKPEVAPQRLKFLAKLFPAAKPTKPLMTSQGVIRR